MTATLKRSLSLGLVTFYGLGTILGAGIYVLIGAVAAAAGPWMPLSFLLAAVIAAVTALSYAELVRRMPLCAAEASYDVTIEVDKVAEMIRPGMKANITATRSLGDKTISVPKDSVASDDQGAYCMVQVGDDFERRAVSVGAGNAERVQVIKGLSVGDAVRVPAK